ncbi:erythromycin esterase family protein [Catalinimonas niigatensis]|uniref:erythromycin esterase family protein n=1 Tax=Catalinimonas niigatensis TaxID=1397264 RepID=UPI0026666D12|nr:erythromycin esterase family protein [Catalinimonas niigatensis]WPP52013.1 erythromycin esterase family protein [Catalinimonas niigatensis]
MKRKIKKILCLGLNSLVLSLTSFGQEAAQSDEALSWIQQNAIPIRHVQAGNDFSDLQPLKQILKDVKVVGLGEATHGTREFFQVKHRLLEFLVKEMDFNAFALEASYAACQPINDYVLYGIGDLATVLTGQGYVVWDTEEMAEMIGWLREYNQSVTEEKKVKFYGLDLSNNEIGRKEILSYLHKVAPERVAATDSLFRVLAREEAKWPMQIDAETEKILLHMLPHLQDLIYFLTENKDKLVSNSTPAAFDQVLQYTRVMKQWFMANTPAMLPPFVDKSMIRSISMAENLMYLLDREGSEAKFVVWEHNSHLARDTWNVSNFQDARNGSNLLGYQLRRKYRDGYYAFSIEFNQGSFQTRSLLPDNMLGDLKEVTVPPAPEGSLPWYLSSTNVGNLILNLRAPVDNPVVEQWLHSPHKVYLASWANNGESQEDYIKELEVKRFYDGILFIDRTTATRPTANALKTAARREGL